MLQTSECCHFPTQQITYITHDKEQFYKETTKTLQNRALLFDSIH